MLRMYLGYYRKYNINDTDAKEETRIIQQDTDGKTTKVNSIDLNKRTGDKVANETDGNRGGIGRKRTNQK